MGLLPKVFELLAVHLLPETLLLSLFLEYRVEEQHFIFFKRTELVPCQWQQLARLGCGDGTGRTASPSLLRSSHSSCLAA